ncbi:phage tail assembly chaperone [Pseudomonas extremaustralis]|uniref:phage tail assembly chaperone n=1 Tax=Pseudomonas extremaustralis TaxID=359110 RepID=UPI002307673B|nr:phage tail assembly chaperone [Pseudomonas extremaustralis]MDB1113776.1 phage tail assembly chaperone [Pseudomonas extremaustralis]
MMNIALVQDNLVVGLAMGDSLGEPIPEGMPVAIGWRFEGGQFSESLSVPVPVDQLAALERDWRDAEVSSTEWLVTRHRDEQDLQRATTLSSEQFAEVLTYRQELRDWPQSPDFPDREHRPIAPAWIAKQSQ